MNRQVLEIEHEGGWVGDMDALAAAAADAQLLACAAFLASHRRGETVVLQDFAALLNVTDWTAARWIKALSDKGLLTYARVNDGLVKIAVKCPRSVSTPQEPPQAPKAAPAPAQAAPQGHKSVEPPSPAPKVGPEAVMGALRAARLKAALDVYQVCETMLARTKSATAVTKSLEAIVKNPMFTRVDLPKELLDADAWLAGQHIGLYRDMPRFLTNWLRNAVKFAERDRPKNANAPKAGKYAGVAAAAKGMA